MIEQIYRARKVKPVNVNSSLARNLSIALYCNSVIAAKQLPLGIFNSSENVSANF